MKRFILFYFINKNSAQNLVPNASFEINTDCNIGLVSNTPPWCSTQNGGGNAGYLNPCLSYSYAQAPNQYLDACFQSYQTVRTGVAYAEIGIYTQSSTQESSHPHVKLIDTLKAGKIYCVTYYVSMWNNARYSVDKLGALLTPTPFPCFVAGGPTVAIAGQYTPQVVSTPSVALEDTLGWMEISGSFTAVGNEAYLTLGDFFTHAQHYIKNSYPTNCNGLAEYYIDDVSVEEVEIAKAKNDTLIYQGDSTIIGLNNSEAALFSWQPSAGLSCTNCPNPKASPSVTTTYTVTKTQCKAVTTDVITVSVSPVGVREMSYWNEVVGVSPNPVNDVLHINFKSNEMLNCKIGGAKQVQHDCTIKITDVLGKLVYTYPPLEGAGGGNFPQSINVSQLETGIYFISILQGNKTLVTKKVVKQ